LFAVANTAVIKRPEAGVIYGVLASVRYEAKVRCIMEDIFNASKMLLDVDAFVTVQNLNPESGAPFSLVRFRSKTVEISYNECKKVGDKVCNNNDLYRKNATQKTIITPLEFTLSLETTSFGDYDQTIDTRQFGPYEDLLQSVTDAEFNATFRITSRPNCLPPKDCDCQAAEGTQWTFSDGTRTKTFFYQQEGDEWGDGEPYRWYWSGFQLVYQTYDPDTYVTGVGGLMLTRHVVLPICDVIDGVPTWIVIVNAQCVRYNNVQQITHDTTDEWDATLQCIEGCEDEYRSAGEPVLSGELVDVEYIGRTTAAGTTECSPPARLGISVQQIATC
jgi:hypothetical protein